MWYIGNLIKALTGCIEYKYENNYDIINCADKEVYSLKKIIELISLKIKGVPSQVRWFPSFFSILSLIIYKVMTRIGINHMPLFVLSTATANIDCDLTKTNNSYLLAPKYSFEESLDRTIEWLKSNHLLEKTHE